MQSMQQMVLAVLGAAICGWLVVASAAGRAIGFIAGNKRLARAAAITAVVTLAAIVWAVWPATAPDPVDQSPEEVQQYLASKDFARQSADVQRQYVHQAFEGGNRRFRPDENLSEDQRRQFRDNMRTVMTQRMQERVDDYFETPPDQREAYLDEIIDDRRDRRPRRGPETQPADGQRPRQRGGQGWRGGRGGRRGFSPDRAKRRIEGTPAEVRAKREEFRRALRKRMNDRGIAGRGRR